MKNLLYLLIAFLMIGCSSSNKTLDAKNCNFERKERVAGMTELIYSIQK